VTGPVIWPGQCIFQRSRRNLDLHYYIRWFWRGLPSAVIGVREFGTPHLLLPDPGLVRPRIAPPDTTFPESLAKTGTVLHTFSRNARIA
jgi:hypothetical protein